MTRGRDDRRLHERLLALDRAADSSTASTAGENRESETLVATNPAIVVVTSPDSSARGRVLHVVHGPLRIGRDLQADLSLSADGGVSRRHCVIRRTASAIEIVDEGSRHGTFVSDVRISSPTQLKPGDLIRVGATTLRYFDERDSIAIEAVQRHSQPRASVENELPLPIIAHRPIVDSQRETFARNKQMLELFECCARYFTFVYLALIREIDDPAIRNDVARIYKDLDVGRRLTIGAWVESARKLAVVYSMRRSPFLPSELLVDRVGRPTWIATQLEELRSMRNDRYGHHSIPGDDRIEADYAQMLEVRAAIESAFSSSTAARLITPTGRSSAASATTMTWQIWHGSNLGVGTVVLPAARLLAEGWSCLVSGDGSVLSLAPFVGAKPCDACGRVEIADARRLDPANAKPVITLEGLTTGHELRLPGTYFSPSAEAYHRAISHRVR
jgi:pSer/pThr/pTyr-binding forkhead associated (FHA) protein